MFNGDTMKITALFVIVLYSLQGHNYYVSASEVIADQSGRSLLIVFDTTASMRDDLQELRQGAAYIVNELKKKEKNPIYNFIFVPFHDPCEYLWIFQEQQIKEKALSENSIYLKTMSLSLVMFTMLWRYPSAN